MSTQRSAPFRAPGSSSGDTLRPSPLETALTELFEAADDASAPVLAMQGARFAPYYRDTGDLVIACTAKDQGVIERLLRAALAESGGRVVSEHRSAAGTEFQLHSRVLEPDPQGHHHLRVHLRRAMTCFGVPVLRTEALLQNRVDSGRFPARPAAAHGALLNFLGPYLRRGAVEPESVARLEMVAEKQPASLRSLAGQLAGTRAAERLIDALRRSNRPALARHWRSFRRAVLVRAVARRPFASLGGVLSHAWSSRVRPLFKPRGMVIALIGANGTGKSSLAEALQHELRGSFSPRSSRIVSSRTTPRPVHETGGLPGRVETWLRATSLWFRHLTGVLLRARSQARRNALVVFDHWSDDWIADPLRFGLRPGSRFVALLARLTPRADAVIVTTASLREVRKRNLDLAPREALRQLQAYEAHASDSEAVHLISTEQPLHRVVEDALDALFLGSVPTRVEILDDVRAAA